MRAPGFPEASPLRHARFRAFYVGTVASALAYAMQATLTAWLMATLTPSVLMVALVQAASNAPTLAFGLFAGAASDIVERRKIIVATQSVMFLVTLMLGIAAVCSVVTPYSLLATTFLIGCCYTFYQPAQLASINDLVERTALARGVALGAVANNAARAAGPALAGMLAALLGTGSALIASAMFFLVLIHAMHRAPRQPVAAGATEQLFSGLAVGLRHVRHSPAMLSLIIKNLAFGICASALWALLPIVARDQLALGAGGYGALFGAFGAGAVAAAFSVPFQLGRQPINNVVLSGFTLWMAGVVLVALSAEPALCIVGAFSAGTAWVTVTASMMTAMQSLAPGWIRARAVATHYMALFSSMALGSIVWGAVASTSNTRIALVLSAILLLALLTAMQKLVLRLGDCAEVSLETRPALISAPLAEDIAPIRYAGVAGPAENARVLIQVEYCVEPADHEGFLEAVQDLNAMRRRHGATGWAVFSDPFAPARILEQITLPSWSEYLRLRERITIADSACQARATKFQKPGVALVVTCLVVAVKMLRTR
ncbi:MAG: MFS transporter [Polaromonas sp.]|nr:MFS transporter [Polaromonas sp.]